MATGSGKTFVMAMAILWQYFNKIFRTKNGLRYSSHFLLIAPNLIVYDRLRSDLEDGKIFRRFPFIPPEWVADFNMQVILQSNMVPVHSKMVLYLTNVQQLYSRPLDVPNPIKQLMRRIPPEEEIIYNDLLASLLGNDDLLILNDEAHHVHSDDLEWNRAIANLNDGILKRHGKRLLMQLDFSATPKTFDGVYFPHIIYDYPLSEAIRDGIVKHPFIGEIENIPEPTSRDFVKKNKIQIETGLEVLKDFEKDLKPVKKKPVLFIMCDSVRNADKVGDYLEKERNLKDKVLVIHTDNKGEITKKDLELARKSAREIDTNQYKVIVSVMMLKEGWDVKNVCTIVPLRAYTSQILVEQTVGRGLRRMLTNDSNWDERLVVIEHPKFRSLWETEIKQGELDIPITSIKKAYQSPNLIAVDKNKLKYDVTIPKVEGLIIRIIPDISKLDIKKLSRFKRDVFAKIKIPKIMYRERELLTQKITLEKELAFDFTDNYDEYLSFITKAILSRVTTATLFDKLVPKVKEYIEKYLFNRKIDVTDIKTVRKLNQLFVREKIRDVFVKSLSELSVKEDKPKIVKLMKTSEIQAFHVSRKVYNAQKTVFNSLPYESSFEKDFMEYLDRQKDVLSYTKNFPRLQLTIPYYDQEHYLRYYTPDFVVVTKKGIFIIETKGAGFEEMETTKLKAQSADRWCENVSRLTRKKWKYVKVIDSDFEKYKTMDFHKLIYMVLKNQ
jgi:type III restriction enzyme